MRLTLTQDKSEPLQALFGWSEFGRFGPDGKPSLQIGSVVTLEYLQKNERDRQHPTRPYYRGELYDGIIRDSNSDDEDEDEGGEGTKRSRKSKISASVEDRRKEVVHFEFNKRRQGWNYSWAANKHTCNVQHCLYMYIMVPHDGTNPDSLRCIAMIKSPPFQVFCRKRPPRGGGKEDEEAQMNSPTKPTSKPASAKSKKSAKFVPVHVNQQSLDAPSVYHYPQQQQQQPAALQPQSVSQPYHQQQHHHETQQHNYYYDQQAQYGHGQQPQHQQYQQQLYHQEQPDYHRYYTTDQGHQAPIAHQHPQAMPQDNDESLFRDFFLDNFWNDEGPNISDFDPSRMKRERSLSVGYPPTMQQQQRQQQGMMLSSNDFNSDSLGQLGGESSRELDPVSNARISTLPKAPPLKELVPRHVAHRSDAPPPTEFEPAFGEAADSEEKHINNRLWRLLLVLAMVEAHWCEISNPAATNDGRSRRYSTRGRRRSSVLSQPNLTFDQAWDNTWGDEDLFADTSSTMPPPPPESAPRTLSSSSNNSSNNPSYATPVTTINNSVPKVSESNRALIQSLATFLIEEKSFTRSIEEALAALPPGSSIKDLKRTFVTVAHDELGKFCENTNGISLAQFDGLFEVQPPLDFLKQAAERLKGLQETLRTHMDQHKKAHGLPGASSCSESESDAWSKENSVGVSGPNHRKKRRKNAAGSGSNSGSNSGSGSSNSAAALNNLGIAVINCSGTYEMDAELLDAHAFMREIRGVPWVLRKMISYIEASFDITQVGYEKVVMQGSAKLLSNGTNIYITDGTRRKFTLQSPIPWSQPLALDYQSWFALTPPNLTIIHYYSETERLKRIITIGSYRLHFELFFQTSLGGNNPEWVTLHVRDGHANLVKQGEGFYLPPTVKLERR